MKKLILSLQIGGFAVALFALSFHAVFPWFIVAFGIHVVGDILFIEKEGL